MLYFSVNRMSYFLFVFTELKLTKNDFDSYFLATIKTKLVYIYGPPKLERKFGEPSSWKQQTKSWSEEVP